MTTPNTKINILNLMGCYWPGHEATGPNQSLRSMMHGLAQYADFSVLAKQSPEEILKNTGASNWSTDGFCRTKRLAVNRLSAKGLGPAICGTPHDILMCNGFFDSEFTINALIQRRLGKIPKKPILLSPRGEFADSALAFGAAKKKTYMRFGKSFGLFSDVWFHATAEHEVKAIEAANLGGRGILTAPNPAKWFDLPKTALSSPKMDKLNLAFLGRISPVKNLLFALQALKHVTQPVRYHIFGPISDSSHWQDCLDHIEELPSHIEVTHKGSLSNDNVPATLSGYDALFLPTQGENFGHAIHESLMSGIPVIISDQTPWRDLEKHKAGWDLSLNTTQSFTDVINLLAEMPLSKRKILRKGARVFAEKRWHESGAIDATKTMIETAIKESK